MIVNVKELLKELDYIGRFVEKKTSIPILAHALICAGGDKLSLVGTDLELTGMTSIPGTAEAPAESWTITAPIRKLKEYLKQVDDKEVSVSASIETGKPVKITRDKLDDNGKPTYDPITRAKVTEEVEETYTTYRLVLHHGDGGEASFEGMDPKCFPEVAIPAKIHGELGNLKQMYQRCEMAISKEESRFTLNGALLILNPENSAVVSTDGHRLSYLPATFTALEPCKTIVMKKALFEAQRMNGDTCLFGMDENFQLFLGHQRSIVARKLKGNFPDYERVLPKEFWRSITVDAKELHKIIKRSAVCAHERSRAIQLYVKDKTLVAEAKQMEQTARGSIPIEWPDDAAWRGGINADYALGFLALADGPVTFGFQAVREGKECVDAAMQFSTPEGWLMVIMPMRI
jgi:DNA polymerase-3 subunit beta